MSKRSLARLRGSRFHESPTRSLHGQVRCVPTDEAVLERPIEILRDLLLGSVGEGSDLIERGPQDRSTHGMEPHSPTTATRSSAVRGRDHRRSARRQRTAGAARVAGVPARACSASPDGESFELARYPVGSDQVSGKVRLVRSLCAASQRQARKGALPLRPQDRGFGA